jgi:transcriptional regulator with XRE-family HTH domain
MTSEFNQLWTKLRDKNFREQLVSEQAKRMIPFQVQALMKARGYTQQRFAELSGLAQGSVSRAADLDYGNLSLNTIVRLAAGFDVAFVGEFVPFSQLAGYFERTNELGHVPTFSEEDAEIGDWVDEDTTTGTSLDGPQIRMAKMPLEKTEGGPSKTGDDSLVVRTAP